MSAKERLAARIIVVVVGLGLVSIGASTHSRNKSSALSGISELCVTVVEEKSSEFDTKPQWKIPGWMMDALAQRGINATTDCDSVEYAEMTTLQIRINTKQEGWYHHVEANGSSAATTMMVGFELQAVGTLKAGKKKIDSKSAKISTEAHNCWKSPRYWKSDDVQSDSYADWKYAAVDSKITRLVWSLIKQLIPDSESDSMKGLDSGAHSISDDTLYVYLSRVNAWSIAIDFVLSNHREIGGIDIPFVFSSDAGNVEVDSVDFACGRIGDWDFTRFKVDSATHSVRLAGLANLPPNVWKGLTPGRGQIAEVLLKSSDSTTIGSVLVDSTSIGEKIALSMVLATNASSAPTVEERAYTPHWVVIDNVDRM